MMKNIKLKNTGNWAKIMGYVLEAYITHHIQQQN